MKEQLEKLSREELTALAEEIVRGLDGAPVAVQMSQLPDGLAELLRTVYGGGDIERQRLVQQLADLAAPRDAVAERPSPLQPSALSERPHATDGAQGAAIRAAAGARFSSAAETAQRTGDVDGWRREVSGPRQDIAALSEHFRRDSRRYDAGFERY